MELRDFMNKYIYNTEGYKEELQKIDRFIKLNERKEENKMEQHIKIIIRKDEQYNSSEDNIKYVLELVNQQDEVIFADYFNLDNNSVLVYLSDHISIILNVYSFNDYIVLLKSYGITHKIKKMLSEEEIREEYSRIINTGSLYNQGYIKALEYVLGIDNE